jgi:hypothetical protein
METFSEKRLVKLIKPRLKGPKEVKLKKAKSNNLIEVKPKKPRSNNLKDVKPRKPRSNNLKEVKPRKPRSKEQAIKCQFCPRSFSFLHWNNGKKSFWFQCFPKIRLKFSTKANCSFVAILTILGS